jgi:pimeloyl-ACP methyl ester carboxylesterase
VLPGTPDSGSLSLIGCDTQADTDSSRGRDLAVSEISGRESRRAALVYFPVLLLWGDVDPISPVAVGRKLVALLPRAELVVVNGGTHDLIFERADDVVPHIETHLAT